MKKIEISIECNENLIKDCNKYCDKCICANCDKRKNCDGGNLLFGCGE